MTSTCPICKQEALKVNLQHRLINKPLLLCVPCNYHFVDCTIFKDDEILKHQNIGANFFGQNFNRNIWYLKYLISLEKRYQFSNILEIGTPKNFDFLKQIHDHFGPKYKLYSHDLIVNKFPIYINFQTDKQKLLSEDIDLLFCIHTLEHVPTTHLLEFVSFCKAVSTYFIFEVPRCETSNRILESSTMPHYSFFTVQTARTLFGDNIHTVELEKTLFFTNIEGG